MANRFSPLRYKNSSTHRLGSLYFHGITLYGAKIAIGVQEAMVLQKRMSTARFRFLLTFFHKTEPGFRFIGT